MADPDEADALGAVQTSLQGVQNDWTAINSTLSKIENIIGQDQSATVCKLLLRSIQDHFGRHGKVLDGISSKLDAAAKANTDLQTLQSTHTKACLEHADQIQNAATKHKELEERVEALDGELQERTSQYETQRKQSDYKLHKLAQRQEKVIAASQHKYTSLMSVRQSDLHSLNSIYTEAQAAADRKHSSLYHLKVQETSSAVTKLQELQSKHDLLITEHDTLNTHHNRLQSKKSALQLLFDATELEHMAHMELEHKPLKSQHEALQSEKDKVTQEYEAHCENTEVIQQEHRREREKLESQLKAVQNQGIEDVNMAKFNKDQEYTPQLGDLRTRLTSTAFALSRKSEEHNSLVQSQRSHADEVRRLKAETTSMRTRLDHSIASCATMSRHKYALLLCVQSVAASGTARLKQMRRKAMAWSERIEARHQKQFEDYERECGTALLDNLELDFNATEELKRAHREQIDSQGDRHRREIHELQDQMEIHLHVLEENNLSYQEAAHQQDSLILLHMDDQHDQALVQRDDRWRGMLRNQIVAKDAACSVLFRDLGTAHDAALEDTEQDWQQIMEDVDLEWSRRLEEVKTENSDLHEAFRRQEVLNDHALESRDAKHKAENDAMFWRFYATALAIQGDVNSIAFVSMLFGMLAGNEYGIQSLQTQSEAREKRIFEGCYVVVLQHHIHLQLNASTAMLLGVIAGATGTCRLLSDPTSLSSSSHVPNEIEMSGAVPVVEELPPDEPSFQEPAAIDPSVKRKADGTHDEHRAKRLRRDGSPTSTPSLPNQGDEDDAGRDESQQAENPSQIPTAVDQVQGVQAVAQTGAASSSGASAPSFKDMSRLEKQQYAASTMQDLRNLFFLAWNYTAEEEEAFVDDFKGLFKGGKTLDQMKSAVDKYCLPLTTGIATSPLPCLRAFLGKVAAGHGSMSNRNCPRCKNKQQCYFAMPAPGLTIESSTATVPIGGHSVRWILKKRRKDQSEPGNPEFTVGGVIV